MDLIWALAGFLAGLVLVVGFAEKLVVGAVGTSLGFGLSAFLVSVLFLGFDPENLAVGVAGSYEQVVGFALGSIVGASMVAVALAFGLTAVLSPMEFAQVPRLLLLVPVLAVVLFGALSMDGQLTRLDGALLLSGFAISLGFLVWLSRHGYEVEPGGEVAETLEEAGKESRWKSLGWLLLSLAAIIVGSELLVRSGEELVQQLGVSDTFFGMALLALFVSIEELARELPAALKGRPDISFGNVVGSVLAFFLMNAGIIVLVRPIDVPSIVRVFYLPAALIAILVLCAFMLTRRITRWMGGVLVLLYLGFVAGGYFL